MTDTYVISRSGIPVVRKAVAIAFASPPEGICHFLFASGSRKYKEQQGK